MKPISAAKPDLDAPIVVEEFYRHSRRCFPVEAVKRVIPEVYLTGDNAWVYDDNPDEDDTKPLPRYVLSLAAQRAIPPPRMKSHFIIKNGVIDLPSTCDLSGLKNES